MLRLDPVSPRINGVLASVYIGLRQWEDTRPLIRTNLARDALDRNPLRWPGRSSTTIANGTPPPTGTASNPALSVFLSAHAVPGRSY